MEFGFDLAIDRRPSDSSKWTRYDDDVLPLCVADMDFASPESVLKALHQRVDHGVFGYGKDHVELRGLIVERLERFYDWQVPEESVCFAPGVVQALNVAVRAATTPGDGVLVQAPVYDPILQSPTNAACRLDVAQLSRQDNGHYAVDWDAFEATISDTTRIFILCNPHNPVGRVYSPVELARMAKICLRHDLVICSDEIHCDLVFTGHRHVPIASLSPEIEKRSITLMAPSKTFNIAGLQCSFVVIPNPELRRRFEHARGDMVSPRVNLLGVAAAEAAYRYGQPWLDAMLRYLEANRDWLCDHVSHNLPGLTLYRPEGTYLAWINARDLNLPSGPQAFFLRQARVALNDGAIYGPGGEGFVRLNFGCPRLTLYTALERMKAALTATWQRR